MATEQPPFQYHLDFRVNHQGDIDGQCKELLFRLRPEWKERELKSKVSEQELKTESSQAAWVHDDIMFTHSGPFAGGYTGPRLNIKTVLSTYGDFHVKDKTAVRTSYL